MTKLLFWPQCKSKLLKLLLFWSHGKYSTNPNYSKLINLHVPNLHVLSKETKET